MRYTEGYTLCKQSEKEERGYTEGYTTGKQSEKEEGGYT
jgi:hypothetical protein